MPLKVAEEVSKNLASLKEVLSGTGDKEPQTEAVAQLAQELYNTDLLIYLIANLQRIDFEVGPAGLDSTYLSTRANRFALNSMLFLTGKEGCGSSVQQHRETPDWRAFADSRIHQRTLADPLHASERVRLNSVCSDLHTRVLEFRQSPVGDQDIHTVPLYTINLNFSVFHSASHAMSYIVLLCFDNSWRYKCKLVAFALNLPVGDGRISGTHRPDRGLSELALIRC